MAYRDFGMSVVIISFGRLGLTCVAILLSFALTWWLSKRSFLAAVDLSGTKSWPLSTFVALSASVLQLVGVMFLAQWTFKNMNDLFATSYFFVWAVPSLIIVLSNSARYGNNKKGRR